MDLFAGEGAPLMAGRKVGSTPTGSASACSGLGSHCLVTTSAVVKRDPIRALSSVGQSAVLMGTDVAGSIPAGLSENSEDEGRRVTMIG